MMYPIPKSIEPHIDEPHVIGVFIGDEQEPALSSLDDLASCVYNARFCGGGLTIGALCSANVSISAYGQHDLSGRDIIVKLGFGDPLEWLQLGAFRVCECHVGDDTTAITAYDAAYWATGGEYIPTVSPPTSVKAVLEDVCEQCNITLGDLPATADRTIDGRLTGYTARQIITHMSAICGCNAAIDRSGALRLKWLSDNEQTVGPDEYYADELTNATTINIVGVQMKTKITTPSTDPDTGITVEREVEKTYSSASGTGRVLAVDCPYANQELVDAIADAIVPLSYTAGSVSFIGGYDIEPGDILTVTALSGAVHSVPVLELTLSLDGGCRATVHAAGYSDTDTSANFDTEYQTALSRLEAAIIAVKNLTADNIEAQSAYIKRLSADEAFVNRIFANDINATGTITGAALKGAHIESDSGKIAIFDIEDTGFFGGTVNLYALNEQGRLELAQKSTTDFDDSELTLWPDGLSIESGDNAKERIYLGIRGTKSKGYSSALVLGGDNDTNYHIELSTHNNGPVFSVSYAGKPVIQFKENANFVWGGLNVNGELYTFGDSYTTGDISTSGTISEGGTVLSDKYAAKSHTHSYLPLAGGVVTGDLRVEGALSSIGATVKVSYAPNAYVSPTGYIRTASSSSIRYKTAIESLPLNEVRGLYTLPIHTYVYKDRYISEEDERYGKRIPGFIAEEVDAVLPIAVDHKDGKAEMWNSNIMVPCLLRLVQDLNERVETLEKRLEALERKE